jgi:hypothetical protein
MSAKMKTELWSGGVVVIRRGERWVVGYPFWLVGGRDIHWSQVPMEIIRAGKKALLSARNAGN